MIQGIKNKNWETVSSRPPIVKAYCKRRPQN